MTARRKARAAEAAKTPSLEGRVGGTEWRLRVELAAAYRLAHRYGWASTLIFNHISARLPGPGHDFLLNPFGLAWDEVTASNLVRIGLDGTIREAGAHGVNHAGFVIHGAIHAARSDVACVLHTHTEAGMAVSALAEGLMFVTQDSLMFYDDIAYHDFEGIVLDADEQPRLVADLGAKNNLILRNHGLLTTGRSVGEAFIRMFFLEKSCRAQLRLMAARGTVRELSAEVCARAAAQHRRGNRDYVELAWPALLRELDRAGIPYRA